MLTACTTFKVPPTTANYGTSPEAYEEKIKVYFSVILKDSESARFNISKPYKAYVNEGWAVGGGIKWIGHAVDVQINAKNSYGGYTGFKPYIVIFNNDNLVKHLDAGDQFLFHRMP